MAAVISLAEAQQWLETTKLGLASLDAELEDSGQAWAFGVVGQAYDTTNWVTPASTPRLVRKAISMWVAGWEYNKRYSEEAAQAGAYGNTLIATAQALLEGVADGVIDLDDEDGVIDVTPTSTDSPLFYPNDHSTLIEESPLMFSMTDEF